jgi:type IV pilus assembly protein PilV
MDVFTTLPRKQQGSMLLEALISILIFSIGILAIIGLQASSIKMSSDAKYRSDASMLANQLISLMWTDVASAVAAPAAFDPIEFVSYGTGGTNFTPWSNTLTPILPNASAAVTTNTILACDGQPCPALPTGVLQTTRTDITISISWHLPDCVASNPDYPSCIHRYSTGALVSAQKQL